jgi:hypothetical protein
MGEPVCSRVAPSSPEAGVRTSSWLLVWLLFAGPAAAQAPESRVTFGAVAGAGQTWQDESSLGGGLLAGARIERRLFGNTRAELAGDLLTTGEGAVSRRTAGR